MTTIEDSPTAAVSTKNMNVSNDAVEYVNIIEQMMVMRSNLTKMISSVKSLQKEAAKKRKVSNVKSGFLKPVKLSETLSSLIGTKPGDLVSRNVVNSKINEYIKANKLQRPDNLQTFVMDDKLGELFNLPKGEVVHYFKMQTFLKNHYPKD